MKNLSLIAAIATASLISFQASGAGFYNSTAVESKMIKGEIVSTQSQAYADGKKMWSDLSDKKSFELSQILLQSNDRVDVKSFELRNGSVEVKEFLDSSGTISFVPMVKVDYRYNYRPSL
ncbi:DUF3316 domain-containing protein [Vibrio splendidus]|uniref:DUF3316 domain-containing protein n=1 Tax=Vibrio splendidus TaxID=29497 RepID=UPI000C833538|nr:DUF3316 domain-containing protein [Vibrio splendidus]PMH11330.1 hypothetical protein BCU75_00860 [Vibrio splendidus]PMI84746.1 hypothetical protein BCU37_11035 [Vibrio splendidus]PMK05316.1 hypothetical protein BCU10_03720 [Vibrio splendidus]PMK54242.1 hypothetical protein BCT96_07395 [Vibrio splendidus]|tara:strand:+ start:293 stop:652 length:360 start_codon:yes stop_codon:yes gene_type:complete